MLTTLFKQSKYMIWYYNIVLKAKCQHRYRLKRSHKNYIYYELHHILPRSIFPEYSNLKEHPWNGVLLTAREHYICHALLVKMTDGVHHHKMVCAFHKMQSSNHSQNRYNSRLFSYNKDRLRRSMSFFNQGRSHTIETRKKISESHKGVPHSNERKNNIKLNHHNCSGENNPNFGKNWSDEWKLIHSEKMKGLLVNERNGMFGRTHSVEVKELLSKHGKAKWTPEMKQRMIETRKRNKEALVNDASSSSSLQDLNGIL